MDDSIGYYASCLIQNRSNINNYSIKVDGLNKKNCMEITEIDWVNKKKVDIYKLEINGSEVAHYPQEGEKSFPIPTMKVISSCSKNGKENYIEILLLTKMVSCRFHFYNTNRPYYNSLLCNLQKYIVMQNLYNLHQLHQNYNIADF